MEHTLKLDRRNLAEIALQIHTHIHSAESRVEALKHAAEITLREMGDCFGPEILINPDDITVNFLELLDHIVFEVEQNGFHDRGLKDYIVDDFYARLIIFLDIFRSRDIYRKNLQNRLLTYEDVLIIRHYMMEEYLDDLIREYSQQPALQKPILMTLLRFDSDKLLNFYYMTLKDEYCSEAVIPALVGLKKPETKFSNWHLLRSKIDTDGKFMEYIKRFNMKEPESNRMPYDTFSLLFSLNFIESQLPRLIWSTSTGWILKVLASAVSLKIDSFHAPEIYMAIARVMINFDIENLRELLKNRDNMISFVYLVDHMPEEYVNRFSFQLLNLGDNILNEIRNLIEVGEITLDMDYSNSLNLLFGESKNSL